MHDTLIIVLGDGHIVGADIGMRLVHIEIGIQFAQSVIDEFQLLGRVWKDGFGVVDTEHERIEEDRVLGASEGQFKSGEVGRNQAEVLVGAVLASITFGVQFRIDRQQERGHLGLVLGRVIMDTQADGEFETKTGIVAAIGKVALDDGRVIGLRCRWGDDILARIDVEKRHRNGQQKQELHDGKTRVRFGKKKKKDKLDKTREEMQQMVRPTENE